MGVYIKDMEMPFTCLTCDFHKCAAGVGDFCSLTKRRQFRFKNRPKDCPLVHIQPHGDLVDKNEMRAIAISLLDEVVTDQEANAIREMWSRLWKMKVFIPAEESE